MARKLIYCDESGDISFSLRSIRYCNYFVICSLTIDESVKPTLRNTMRRKRAKLIKLGWPCNIEIKAHTLHTLAGNENIPRNVKDKINGDDFIREILNALKNTCSPSISYIVVNKSCIKNQSLRNAPYGIAYNYFAGKILIPLVYNCADCLLTMDKRNKESHSHKNFDGYIQSTLFKKAFEANRLLNFEVQHVESHIEYGLQAVDFFAWSIYRAKNRQDDSFLEIFRGLVADKQEWYC